MDEITKPSQFIKALVEHKGKGVDFDGNNYIISFAVMMDILNRLPEKDLTENTEI